MEKLIIDLGFGVEEEIFAPKNCSIEILNKISVEKFGKEIFKVVRKTPLEERTFQEY